MKRLPWWQNFQVVAWVVGGLTALGTVAVVTAKYIELPTKVEAAEQKNAEQDQAIDKLTTINETWQNIYQQQQQQVPNQPARQPGRFWDDEAQRFYCDDGWTTWWADAEGRCR